jgi:hypothetical protein
LGVSPSKLLITHLQVLIAGGAAKLVDRPRYLIVLLVHKLLLVLANLRCALRVVLSVASPFRSVELVVAAIPRLINLLHLVLILLQGGLVIVEDDVFLGAAVLVVGRLLTRRGVQLLSISAACGPKTLLIKLAILTVSFLLLGLHLQIFDVLFIRVLVRLIHKLIVHFDALGRRVAHSLYFSIVVLHFDFFQTLISDFTQHVWILLLSCANYLRGRFR